MKAVLAVLFVDSYSGNSLKCFPGGLKIQTFLDEYAPRGVAIYNYSLV